MRTAAIENLLKLGSHSRPSLSTCVQSSESRPIQLLPWGVHATLVCFVVVLYEFPVAAVTDKYKASGLIQQVQSSK